MKILNQFPVILIISVVIIYSVYFLRYRISKVPEKFSISLVEIILIILLVGLPASQLFRYFFGINSLISFIITPFFILVLRYVGWRIGLCIKKSVSNHKETSP